MTDRQTIDTQMIDTQMTDRQTEDKQTEDRQTEDRQTDRGQTNRQTASQKHRRTHTESRDRRRSYLLARLREHQRSLQLRLAPAHATMRTRHGKRARQPATTLHVPGTP